MIHLFFGVGPLGQLLRNVGDVGFGVQEQTYLCLHAFSAPSQVGGVCAHWRGASAEYRHDTLEKVTEMLRAESARELAEAEASSRRWTRVRRTMRTLLVSARVVAYQRAEVLSLATKGLIPDSEREVLLHQVLADSHEIARHALDRRVEEHRRLAARPASPRPAASATTMHTTNTRGSAAAPRSRSDVSDAPPAPTPDPASARKACLARHRMRQYRRRRAPRGFGALLA
ncbi:potassium:proton antiporter [Aureococcus anophagefferens]|nr:potassium:proton antiporter [Aureococcus anophagefferens]